MIPYWILFWLPALMALTSKPGGRIHKDGTRFNRFNSLWALTFLTLTVMIGLRFLVGGDWGAYSDYFWETQFMSLEDVLTGDDPGYRLMNWISVLIAWDVQGVNLMSGAIFSWGLIAFCRSLPRPWLGLTVAVPYLVIVVAMGYTRQSVAIGMVMLGLVALSRHKYLRFILWVFLAAFFHKSAVILLPIVALTATRNRWLVALLVLVTVAVGYWAVLAESANTLVRNYIDSGLASTGTLIRLGMNVIPAAVLLYYRNRLRIPMTEYKVWTLFSLISLALFFAYFASSASTAIDRIALYMIPLQIFLFAHLPDLMGRYGKMNQAIVALIVGYYATILFVWLTLGGFARAWVPYRMSLPYRTLISDFGVY